MFESVAIKKPSVLHSCQEAVRQRGDQTQPAHPEAVHTRMLTQVDGISEQLRHICDVNDKHGPDMVFYRWSEAKTMSWLRRKVQAVMQLIAADPTLAHGTGSVGAKGLNFCKNPTSRVAARKKDPAAANVAAWEMGFSIISEYVDQSVGEKLREALVCDWGNSPTHPFTRGRTSDPRPSPS